jgi:hypothetical protein
MSTARGVRFSFALCQFDHTTRRRIALELRIRQISSLTWCPPRMAGPFYAPDVPLILRVRVSRPPLIAGL